MSDLRATAGQLWLRVSRKNRLLVGIVAVTLIGTVMLYLAAPKPQIAEVEEKAWPIATMLANPGSTAPEVALYGRVETPRTSLLTSASTAFVQTVPVLEGQHVKQGDVLVLLDDVDARLLVAQRQADVTNAEANMASMKLQGDENVEVLVQQNELLRLTDAKVERHRQLREQASISEERLNEVLREAHQQAIVQQQTERRVADFDNQMAQARARTQRAEALLDEANVALDRTRIRAPFDGRITQVFVSPGERLSPGSQTLQLYDTAELEIRAQIPTRLLQSLRHVDTDFGPFSGKGAVDNTIHAQVFADGRVFAAVLNRLSGNVAKGASGVDGLFRLLDSDLDLELGRAVDMKLRLPIVDNVVAVPMHALYGDDRLFIVEGDRLRRVVVTRHGEITTAAGNYNVLIRSPELTAGTMILTTQLSNAVAGLKVRVTQTADHLRK